ncbi:MAG TPA: hypothetical protein VGD01_14005 [Candidatus Elarobacter sp.]
MTGLLLAFGYAMDSVRRSSGARDEEPTRAVGSRQAEERRQPGDGFLLSLSVSFNQGVVPNIDAIDAASIGILGATVAFAVLTVDKIREIAEFPRWMALTFLMLSGLVSSFGYAYGFVRGQPRDVPRPSRFVPDFSLHGSKALARATHETVRRSEENLRIRGRKRVMALGAVGLLIAGAVVIAYARLAGGTVPPVAHGGGMVQ